MAMASNITMSATPAPGNVNTGATYNPNYKPVGATSSLPAQTTQQPATTPSQSPQPGAVKSPYAVVTSKPATQDYTAIQNDYNTNIKPNLDRAAQTTAQSSQLPVIQGYNVSATPTGNLGETKATNQATGSSYYITPQKPGLSAEQVQSMIAPPSAPEAPSAPSTPSTPAPQTPSDVAAAAAGTTLGAENAQFAGQVQGVQDDMSRAYQTFQATIQNVMSGAFPLTPAQQTLVDATNAAFRAMNGQAELKAAALSSETGGVSTKVNAMAGQMNNIISQQAAAVAKLEIGFQENNYKMITESYANFKDLEKSKLATITSLHNTVVDTYKSALQAAQAQQTFQQTVYRDAKQLEQSDTEFRDVYDAFGNKIGTQAWSKSAKAPVSSPIMNPGQSDPKTGITTPIVTTNPTTGAVDQTAQQRYLQTVPPAFRDLIVGIANGKIEPPSARTAKGAQILSMVAQYDPTLSDGSGGFDATKYAARLTMQKSLASYTAGSLGQAVLSSNKVVSHLASFANSAASIPGRGAVNPFNINKLTSGALEGGLALVGVTGPQQAQAKAEQEARGLTDEMTKFFKGTGGTDVESLKSWGASLNPNAASGTQKGIIQGTLDLFSGQLNSFIQQYTTVMGHAPEIGTIIQPQTLQTLSAFKNAGYNVDIPGVYYTDKNAYLSNGGSQENLSKAFKTLQDNGIPTTPENILQAAQVMNE